MNKRSLTPELSVLESQMNDRTALERAAEVCEKMRPAGGRAWSTEQQACWAALTDAAKAILALAAEPKQQDLKQQNDELIEMGARQVADLEAYRNENAKLHRHIMTMQKMVEREEAARVGPYQPPVVYDPKLGVMVDAATGLPYTANDRLFREMDDAIVTGDKL